MRTRYLIVLLAVFAGCGDTITNNYWGTDASSDSMPNLAPTDIKVLDGEELNLGRTEDVPSLNFVAPNVAPNGLVGPGQPVRLLDVLGSSQQARQITFTLSAYLKAFDNAGIGTAGPIVARIEFGSGGAASHFIEFDVPMGAPTFVDPASTVGAQTDEGEGGVILTLPGSSFRIIVSNDGADLPRNVLGDPVVDELVAPPVPSLQLAENASLVVVRAHASYNARPSGQKLFPHRFLTLTRGAAALANGMEFRIPPFAKRVRIVRNVGFAVTLTWILVQTNIGGIDTVVIPAGVVSPEIEIPTGAGSFIITTDSPDTWGDFSLEA